MSVHQHAIMWRRRVLGKRQELMQVPGWEIKPLKGASYCRWCTREMRGGYISCQFHGAECEIGTEMYQSCWWGWWVRRSKHEMLCSHGDDSLIAPHPSVNERFAERWHYPAHLDRRWYVKIMAVNSQDIALTLSFPPCQLHMSLSHHKGEPWIDWIGASDENRIIDKCNVHLILSDYARRWMNETESHNVIGWFCRFDNIVLCMPFCVLCIPVKDCTSARFGSC